MTAKLIKGTEVREEILREIAAEVKEIKEKHGAVPGLVTILVGENPASISYVTLKIKTANELGFKEIQDSQPENISEADLLGLVDQYNHDDSIHGILVQLPLPKHLDEKKDQRDPVNATLLYILDKIASLLDPGNIITDEELLQIATQANNIRGKFLDVTKKLSEAIPDVLLKKGDYNVDEIPPSKV